MKIGVIVARLQTDMLHGGHISLIDRVKEVSDAVTIVLGTARAKGSLKNPLDFQTRKLMVQGKYPEIHCIEHKDNKSDYVWSSNLDKILDSMSMDGGNEITLHHSRDSFVSHYHGRYPTKEWDCSFSTSATERRENIYVEGPVNDPMFRRGIIYNSFNRYPICYPAVDIFVYDYKNKKVLMGRREGMEEWRLPGGMVDPSDNSFKAAAVRELQEETGLVIPISNFTAVDSFKVADWGYPETGKDRIFTTLFYVECDDNQEAIAADDIAEVKWFYIEVLFAAAEGRWTDCPIQIAEEHKELIITAYNLE